MEHTQRNVQSTGGNFENKMKQSEEKRSGEWKNNQKE